MGRKVAIYARVSTEHEAQISALDNQIQYYSELLDKHPDFELYDRYIDEGITGTSVKKRASFMRMMEDAAKGCFDLIITREVSRFARNTVDTLQETRKLKAMGVEVWFTEDNIWTMDDSDGELRLTIMATLAQNESKKTSMRVKAGQMISFKNGVPYGNGNILGYDKLPNHGGYVINPEQAETVRMIYDLYLSGEGIRSIQFILEQRGRKTATGLTNWAVSNISRILKNPFYCGILEYRKQYVPDYLEQKKINNHGAVERIRVQGTHTPIITEEEFNKVAERFAEKTKEEDGKRTGLRDHCDVWGRKLVCSCGKNFRKVKYYTSKGCKKSSAYQCGGQIATGTVTTRLKKGLSTEGICRAQFLQSWKLEVQAATILNLLCNRHDKVKLLAEQLLEQKIFINEKQDAKHKEINRLKLEIERTEKAISKLLDLRLADEISRDDYSRKREELENLMDDLNKKVDDLNRYDQVEESIQDRAQILLKLIEDKNEYDFSEVWESFVEHYIAKIVVYEDHTEWYLIVDKDSLSKVGVSVEGTKKVHKISTFDDFTLVDKCETGSYR